MALESRSFGWLQAGQICGFPIDLLMGVSV
jgi:hypothetical protein